MRIAKKKIAWDTVLLILIAGGVICKIRWKVQFHNIPEIRYVLTEDPQRVSPTLGNDGELSRNVSWMCGGVPKQAKLEYAKIGSEDTFLVDGPSRFLRTLDGFGYASWTRFKKPSYGDSYSYRVWDDDRPSGWYSFTIQPDSTDHLSFIFIGDVQDILHGKTHGFMEDVCHRYSQANFYMFAGDFAERSINCYQDGAHRSVDSVAPTKPISIFPGNHGYVEGLARVLEKRFAYIFSYPPESRYKNNSVYFIDCNDTTTIALNGNHDPWFLPSRQEWLEETLKASKKKWRVIVLRHPVYSMKDETNNLTVHWMFDRPSREYGIDLVLQGHGYNYARTANKNDESEVIASLYLISHTSPKNHRLSLSDRYDCFRANCRFYQHIDVTGDTFRVQAYLGNDSPYDNTRIVKDVSGIQIIDNVRDIPKILEMPVGLSGKKAEKFEWSAGKWRNRSLTK